jgi:hypothetical protein
MAAKLKLTDLDMKVLRAAREFDAARDSAKPALAVWLEKLPGLPDDDFLKEAATAIYDAALTNSWGGNWFAEDCEASAAYMEARRRHEAAGHTADCTGDTIYIDQADGWEPANHG